MDLLNYRISLPPSRIFLATNVELAPLRLLKFFVVMRVGAIALFPESNYLRSIQPVTSPRGSLAGYLQPTKSLFENFLSIPISEYRNFSMLEWTRLIQTIISLISTCLAMVAAPEVDSIDADQASHFGIYLESLCFRMDELTTVTKDTKTGPDIFCMFKSVLRIVRGTYEEMIMKISRKSDCGGGEEQMSRFPSICPMLNGSIRRTEYWNVLNNSDTNSAFDDDCMASGIAGFGLLPYFESWDTWELGVADSSDLPFYD